MRIASASVLVTALVFAPCVALVAPARDAHAEVRQAPTDAADAIVGRWAPEEGDAVVAIVKSGATYGGVVTSSTKDPSRAGMSILRGLAYDAGRATWTGEVFAPKRGQWVYASIKMKDARSFVMTAGRGLFTKTVTWTRR